MFSVSDHLSISHSVKMKFSIICSRVKRDGADCVLGAGNQFSAPGSYQECPNELYFEVGHSINKFKFSGTVLVVSGCWNLVSSTQNAVSTVTLYSRRNFAHTVAIHSWTDAVNHLSRALIGQLSGRSTSDW